MNKSSSPARNGVVTSFSPLAPTDPPRGHAKRRIGSPESNRRDCLSGREGFQNQGLKAEPLPTLCGSWIGNIVLLLSTLTILTPTPIKNCYRCGIIYKGYHCPFCEKKEHLKRKEDLKEMKTIIELDHEGKLKMAKGIATVREIRKGLFENSETPESQMEEEE